MVAYVIGLRKKVTNDQEFAKYGAAVGDTLAPHGIKVRARDGRLRVLEGTVFEGAVIVEFPSFEEAEAWYDGAAYSEIREYRQNGAEFDIFIINGS